MMRTPSLLLLLSTILLGACAKPDISVATAPPPPNSMIVYETTPCYGTCPVYRIVLSQLTGDTFIGERHTALIGNRNFAAPDGLSRVTSLLAPWRPQGSVRYAPGEKKCPNAPTDLPGVRVTWSEGSGEVTGQLEFYYGCASVDPELAAALRKVPGLLPIGDLIGM